MSTPKTKAAPRKKAETAETVVAYKGFNSDWACRGFQYEVGKTYRHKGYVSLCKGGFHACEHPLSVWCFYPPTYGNRFAVVEQFGDIASDGTVQASRTVTIKAEVDIPGLVKAAVEWACNAADKPTSGDHANSATNGDHAHSATSGYCANSTTSGDWANSATSGDCANSTTSGYSTQAEASGKHAVAAVAGSGSARAGDGGAIFLVERDATLAIVAVFASMVGENGIKPDTWYALKGGKPVEVTP